MQKQTPIKLNITKTYLVEGEYEGHVYHKLNAETSEGIKLSTKLTSFEYNTLLAKLAVQTNK